MTDRSTFTTLPDGTRIETGIFTHEGRDFAAGGSFVSPTHAIGYPSFPDGEHVGARGVMCTWSGEKIGSCRVVAKWQLARWSPIGGDTMRQIEATIDGRTYTGRGFGNGMIWRGKLKRS